MMEAIGILTQELFLICKGTNLKAIHNAEGAGLHGSQVVFDMQRY